MLGEPLRRPLRLCAARSPALIHLPASGCGRFLRHPISVLDPGIVIGLPVSVDPEAGTHPKALLVLPTPGSGVSATGLIDRSKPESPASRELGVTGSWV